jgi:hypothetical protein
MNKCIFIILTLLVTYSSTYAQDLIEKEKSSIEEALNCKIITFKKVRYKQKHALELNIKPNSSLVETSQGIYASKVALEFFRMKKGKIKKSDSIGFVNIILNDSSLFDFEAIDLKLINDISKNYLSHQKLYLQKKSKKLYEKLDKMAQDQITFEKFKGFVDSHQINKNWEIDNQGFDFVKDQDKWWTRFYMNFKLDKIRTKLVFVYSLDAKDKKLYGFHQNQL